MVMFLSSSFLNLTVWTPEMAWITIKWWDRVESSIHLDQGWLSVSYVTDGSDVDRSLSADDLQFINLLICER